MGGRRRVVVTGAAGEVAGQVLPGLRERYDLVLLDVCGTDRQGAPVEGIRIADLSGDNREAYRHHFEGADAVVHFALQKSGGAAGDVKYRIELDNVRLVYNVCQTSLEAGVRRVVVASSNHAADYWEPMILDGGLEGIGPDAPALSDNYYGWAKQACEHLGFVFAVGRETGGPLENVQIRIGGATEAAVARCGPGEARRLRRALAVYVSARDLQQLIIKSIETEDIRDERGVPFQIFYGISNNARAFWSIASARRVVGYEPQDDSEERFAEQIPTS